jgi:hypothetical protein
MGELLAKEVMDSGGNNNISGTQTATKIWLIISHM